MHGILDAADKSWSSLRMINPVIRGKPAEYQIERHVTAAEQRQPGGASILHVTVFLIVY